MEGVDEFDPLFFNISPREAEIMDPQERLFLECVFETLEDAGYTRETLSRYRGSGMEGNVGVYVGVMYEEYQLYGAQEQIMGRPVALGGSPASIANRVSYFCNFHGPSMAVDTMCSSSLTAIHLACQSLQQGRCKLAIAGGVNVSIHPNKYLMLGQGKFVSSKGRCESFGEGGDGYVPGEGVGAILLKPMSMAISDGDNIYGIIKGTAINHGGKTNGYSVPNLNAQAGVIGEALKEAGIDPRTISYIEAHGTGTSLGDPIEIAGLTKAFQEYTKDKQFCAIGSAKSNIGHCESAAGIAGVTKVLLQLKHRQLVPSLHSEILNPNIDFSNTPFAVQRELVEWKRPVVEIDGKVREYPRRAGISSFGAGGSNAHILIEEYTSKDLEKTPIATHTQNTAIVVLSAKNEERLEEQVQRLVTAIRGGQFTDADLPHMAYTLQVGREAMEERLAVTADSIKELEEKLENYICGGKSMEGLYRGQVKRNKDTLSVFNADEDLQKAVNAWIAKGKYAKLIELWVNGVIFDWNRLYGETKPLRISLPTYSFARERYWMPENKVQSAVGTATVINEIHPLLHQNTSNFSEQRFTSIFTGQEFFLSDHIVKGHLILPGVAYLEMIRAAVDKSIDGFEANQTGMLLKNVVWVRPITVGDQPIKVHVGLLPGDGREITCEIYIETDNAGTEPVVHSRGSAVLIPEAEAPVLDLSDLQTRCSRGTLSSGQCYEFFKSAGLEYGLGYRGIEKVHIGTDQVLAKLSLPSSVSNTQSRFVLHPSLMDAAIQASIGLMMTHVDNGSKAAVKPALPFALEELEILGGCTSSMWSLVRPCPGNKAGDQIQKLDIDLLDEEGKVRVRLKGLSLRILEDKADSVGTTESTGTLMLHPCWKEEVIISKATAPEYVQHIVMLCENVGISVDSMEPLMNHVHFITLESEQRDIEKQFSDYAVQAFEELQGILKDRPSGNVLIQMVVSAREERQLFSGLSALLKTAQLENPKLMGQLIEIETDADWQRIRQILKENSQSPTSSHVRYRDGKRYVAGWSEVEASQEAEHIPWKDRGIYLITGGAGGLGLIFAKEIADKVKNATLVLTGRSLLNEDKEAVLKELEALCAKVEYKQVDVTHSTAVDLLVQSILEEYGGLDGIIHSAGITRDNFIIKKTREELLEVLAPKVTGLVNMDKASKDLPLDFFILFSSMSGSLGNVGQADYAAANAFMDVYAKYRSTMVALKKRQGQTLSINWPLWKEGGMHISEENEKIMRQKTGMTAMQTVTGIRALYRGLASEKEQVMVMEGNVVQMGKNLTSEAAYDVLHSEKASKDSNMVAGSGTESLMDKVQADLMQMVSKALKVKLNDIEPDTELNEYGFDSITFTEFANKLNDQYKLDLTPTIFFEYTTLHSLVKHLVEEYRSAFALKFDEPQRTEVRVSAVEGNGQEPAEVSLPSIKSSSRFRQSMVLNRSETRTTGPEPIAIIGMSGRFPMAEDINQFWQQLLGEKDCITEIPKNRWDWRAYYGDPSKEANKTNIKWGGFIDGVDEFDPMFFGISPREAELMDPQQRLLMVYAWKAIEDAGYSPQSLSGTKTGIFVGTAGSGYSGLVSRANIAIEGYSSTGMVPSVGPNRMSYFLNIHGPSEPIETACSSSLVAIHRAVGAIEDGSCDMAIIGGVNTIVTPDAHISFSKASMLCEDGRCKTFSNQANGYVRGEGVGMLFLKKLKDAEKAGDHIYGVIRSTSENHGGRANSLTAPNPKAQAELLKTAYTKAGIDPRTVSYIEAHGTGTELGDPIEINALKTAFKELYQTTGNPQITSVHCGLGSVKSNIGHLELAAGIAGVIKVLLQLKHKTLVKSLHCDTVNPYIQLKDSPFYIVQKTKEWSSLKDDQGKNIPRRAGVSSFGFGGVNAHVVIEEYVAGEQITVPVAVNTQDPAIIVLSARDEAQLKGQVEQLLSAIKEQQFSDLSLTQIAYTLQVGRDAMEERLAVVVESIEQLQEKLKAFLDGQSGIENLYRGQVKRDKGTLAIFTADEELREVINKWIQGRKFAKLIELWVKGLFFDWNKLYGSIKPRRISLPTYPFGRDRYWIPEKSVKPADIPHSIHPLLNQNTSDLLEQRFTSTFTGTEFFLENHVVKGQRVLPGVAYLEMAREAVERAAGAQKGSGRVRLKNVVWTQPAVVEKNPVQMHIGLFPEDNGEIAYEIYSQSENTGVETVVHGRGSAVMSPASEAPYLDLSALQELCSRSTLSANQCYEAFQTMGLEYGPGFRGIEKVNVGSGQVLAKLTLPDYIWGTEKRYTLHPGIMDAALQASIGLVIAAGDTLEKAYLNPTVPFALQELEFFDGCNPAMWALVRFSGGSKAGDKIQKLDIDLCDEQGKVCVRLKGLSSRVLEGEADSKGIGIREKLKEDSVASTGKHDGYRDGERYAADCSQAEASQEAVGIPATGAEGQAPMAIARDLIREKAENYFKKLLSSAIKLPVNRIEADAPMEKYGIDSFMVIQLTSQLEKIFGSLPKTLFFEYQNIRDLTGYFIERYTDRLKGLLGIGEKAADAGNTGHTAAVTGTEPVKALLGNRRQRRFAFRSTESREEKEAVDIAIIGISGRYPKAGNIQEYWRNLKEGKDCITEIPKSRWDYRLYFDEDRTKPGKTYSKWGGFIDGVDQFDPLFFNISPREAEILDPQERLFLQCVYETLEDAGYTRETLGRYRSSGIEGNVGVYVGVMYEEYQLYGAQEQIMGRPVALAGNPSSIANRVSYFCNFHGPSMAVDTMCSSSLTAIYLACQSLQQGGCELAVAGGVNVSIHPNKYLMLGQGKFISSKGHCESFGEGGDGYVPGEGVGAVLLKPLAKAIADGDNIYGVIKGTAINHGGKTNGYSVPNPNAQANVIVQAFKKAGIDPRTVSYIEAHGTGTSLGDPIEIAGLTKAFGEYTKDKQFCAIGSAKSNIGHCESAAGIAGVTKVLLQLKHRQLVPSLHSEILNPHIDFINTPFVVQQELAEWKRPVVEINGETREYPRRAGISSFGAGGSNAHILIEEYIPEKTWSSQTTVNAQSPAIMVLSAKDEERLKDQVQRLLDGITEGQFTDADLANMAYTLQVGREAMGERLAVLADSIDGLEKKLKSFVEGQDPIEDLFRGQAKRKKESLGALADDESMEKIVEDWISKSKYSKLIELWVNGLNFDWDSLYRGTKAKRISMPTYPFARERCWLPNMGVQNSSVKISQASSVETPDSIGTLMLCPYWKEEVISMEAEAPDYAQHLVMLCPNIGTIPESMEKQMNRIRLKVLRSEEKGVEKQFRDYTVQAFEEIRGVLMDKSRGKVLIQVVVCGQGEQRLFTGLSGILKTAQLENPKLIGQLIEIEPGDEPERIWEILKENSRSPMGNHVRYREGKRYVVGWSQIEASQEASDIPWKDRGIYLITGGAGGLGLIFAKEIADKARDTAVILTGRSSLNKDKKARLKELEALGARVDYRQVDVTRREEVNHLIQSIREEFGSLDGIIHCAGVTRDNFILKKTKDELLEVLTPKVEGLVNLDEASRELPLDFFILFSSMAGVLGNIGQSDYATANAFMDAYSQYRSSLVATKQRYGQTLSINWPLWKEGGMHVDEQTEEKMLQAIGMIAMDNASGIRAMYQGFAVGGEQIAVIKGDLPRLREYFTEAKSKVPVSQVEKTNLSTLQSEPGLLKEKVLHQLKVQFGEITKVDVDKIDGDEYLESYGIDSVMIAQLNQKLEDVFGELPKTIFFEYKSLSALTEYLIELYPKECIKWTGFGNPQLPAKSEVYAAAERRQDEYPVTASLKAEKKPENSYTVISGNNENQEPMAIIGVSGHYPLAKNPQEFWGNLIESKKCIREIPGERWDWKENYETDPELAVENGKSYCNRGAFLDDFSKFDPLFFNISPADAFSIDPHERLFLETCWEAVEDAGYCPQFIQEKYQGEVGVFVGVTKSGFNLYKINSSDKGIPYYPRTSFSSIANRVSYCLNLTGPSLAIDTMCSSAVVAIHEACEHIRRGECELALAGGVNLYLHPTNYKELCQAKMLSKDGAVRCFSPEGKGWIPGEGVGAILIKPFKKAVQDGDHIYGVIKASRVKHGGKANGYSTPNAAAQKELFVRLFEESGIHPRSISYVEAAANGSDISDAIELNALISAFEQKTNDKQFCRIGTLKPNYGHSEAASGIAQITKVLYQMKHNRIAPVQLDNAAVDPRLSNGNSPFVVLQSGGEWITEVKQEQNFSNTSELRALISSAGAGGVYAALIVESYTLQTANKKLEKPSVLSRVIPLSAKTEKELKIYAERLLKYVVENIDNIDMESLAYTLKVGREPMEYRVLLTAHNADQLNDLLQAYIKDESNVMIHKGTVKLKKEDQKGLEKNNLEQKVLEAIKAEDTETIARLWTMGVKIDWNALYSEKVVQKMSLPTYPFNHRPFWLEGVRLPDMESGEIKGVQGPTVKDDAKIAAQPKPITTKFIPLSTNAYKESRFTIPDTDNQVVQPEPKTAKFIPLESESFKGSTLTVTDTSNQAVQSKQRATNFIPLSIESLKVTGLTVPDTVNKAIQPKQSTTKFVPLVAESLREQDSEKVNGEEGENNTGENYYPKEAPSFKMTREYILKELRELLNSILYLDADHDFFETRTFSEMGIDSINVVRFIKVLNQKFSLELHPTVVFDYPDINELSKFIYENLNSM
ncbi:MAG: SDR family NAD(P)-dependent oxidoreductase [Clostridia bacterium]|nr:SDR family NAD(P)-dependent oxidoreductase [Clostridia bacterium]